MILSDEKDTSNWETIAEYSIIKREVLEDLGDELTATITGEYGDWTLDLMSDEKGGLSHAILSRCRQERYTFSGEIGDPVVVAEANNANRMMDCMLYYTAMIIKKPEVVWRPQA